MKKGKPPEGGWSTFGCEGLACPTGGNPLSCFLPLGSGPRYRKAFQGKNRGVSFYYFLKLSEPHLILGTNYPLGPLWHPNDGATQRRETGPTAGSLL